MIITTMSCPQCDGEGVAAGVECPACNGTGEVEADADTELSAMVDATRSAMPPALQLPEDPVTHALAEVSQKNATLTDLHAKGLEMGRRYAGVAFDVRSTKGMLEAVKARRELREDVRYPMQKLQEGGSKLLGSMQKQFNRRAKEMIEEVEKLEVPVHEQIVAEENRKEAERQEREAAEQRRRQSHIDAIAAMHRMVTEASGMDSASLQPLIDGAQKIVIDDGYEEFQGQAQQAKDEVLRQLNGMLVAARAEEAELEETRRQQAALREAQAQLAAQQREHAEREAEFAKREQELADKEKAQQAEAETLERAKQERAEAVQGRIDAIRLAGEPLEGRDAEQLRGILSTLRSLVLSVDLLDDRVAEAAQMQDKHIQEVESALVNAEAREAEGVRQQQITKVQELIDNIRGMGENATLAVQDGSADVEQLRAGMEELYAIDFQSNLFDNRQAEAEGLHAQAIDRIMTAIVATAERDRLRAEETERKQAEHTRMVRVQERAHRLFLALKALRLELLAEQDDNNGQRRDSEALTNAEALINEIEGENHA